MGITDRKNLFVSSILIGQLPIYGTIFSSKNYIIAPSEVLQKFSDLVVSYVKYAKRNNLLFSQFESTDDIYYL